MIKIEVMSLKHVLIAACAVCVAPSAGFAAADIPAGTNTQAELKVTNDVTQGNWKAVKDSDWYRVQLKKGVPLAAFLEEIGPDETFYTLTLRDAKGKVIKSGEGDFERPAGFEYIAPKSGLYYLESTLTANFGDGSPKADFYISIGSDCPGNLKTTCVLKLGKPQTRRLSFFDDLDYFRLQVSKGKTYKVTGDNKGDFITHFRLAALDAEGKEIASSPSGSSDQAFSFKATYSGTAFIKAYSYEELGAGTYTITVK